MKALADTPLGVVGEVLCVVAPPSPIIVPEVVEWIVRGPDGEDRLIKDRCAHVGVMCGCHIRNPGNKKAPFRQERRFIKPGEIFVRRISPRRTSSESLRSATVGFLRPRLAALAFTPMHS